MRERERDETVDLLAQMADALEEIRFILKCFAVLVVAGLALLVVVWAVTS